MTFKLRLSIQQFALFHKIVVSESECKYIFYAKEIAIIGFCLLRLTDFLVESKKLLKITFEFPNIF